MTPTEVLIAARDLIADTDHWCQEVSARTVTGEPTTASSDTAAAWCATGAIRRIAVTDRAYLDAKENLVDVIGSVPGFNDTHTHGEVLAAFDRAIEATT